jgi:hypothetical protein
MGKYIGVVGDFITAEAASFKYFSHARFSVDSEKTADFGIGGERMEVNECFSYYKPVRFQKLTQFLLNSIILVIIFLFIVCYCFSNNCFIVLIGNISDNICITLNHF